jgi:CBS domain-containing protein
MMAGGTKVRNVTSLITTFSDAIFKRVASLMTDEMGPPPARFAFIVLGSEGRKEQTLKTDQDNAIIFEDVAEGSEQDVHNYFLALGEKVCTWLDQAGYDFCTGGIMAKNPKWCQPLSSWKKYFSDWIHAAEPEDLLHSSIFFDFRFAYGDMYLVDNLGKYLNEALVGWTGFFRHLTENALHFKPPIGFFGNFVTESKGEHRNALNIKSAMTPIVDFARIYALNKDIRETNTQERLYRLYLKKVLSRDEYNDIEQAYAYMMQLRFVRQITAIADERTDADNYVNPKELSRIERKMLKVIFKRIENIQSKLSFDFIGEV